MSINETLLDSLQNSIKTKGVTEKECLVSCGINTSFFSDWKAGRMKSPSLDKIYRICQYLNITIDSLISPTTVAQSLTENEQEAVELVRRFNDARIQTKFIGKCELIADEMLKGN